MLQLRSLPCSYPRLLGRRRSMNTAQCNNSGGQAKRLPILLFDVMGTIVRDPFYDDMPAFFGISMKELMEIKHPTAWIEFEKGLIEEDELRIKFFKDGRSFDFDGLKNCMLDGYDYLEGMQELLNRLKIAGYDIHAFTNYPHWYKLIEEKLQLSQFLQWSFVSCHSGRRKPDKEAFLDALHRLQVEASDCAFIDDQKRNIEAAKALEIISITFQNAKKLEDDLVSLGLLPSTLD